MDAKVVFIKYVELCPNMSVPTKTSVSDLRFKPAGGSHIFLTVATCQNCMILHCTPAGGSEISYCTGTACWWKSHFLLYTSVTDVTTCRSLHHSIQCKSDSLPFWRCPFFQCIFISFTLFSTVFNFFYQHFQKTNKNFKIIY
jgi:hypothetical protein